MPADKIPDKPKDVYRPVQQPLPTPKGGLSSQSPDKPFQKMLDQFQEHETPKEAPKETPKPIQSHDERREGMRDDHQKKVRDREIDREEKNTRGTSREGDRGKIAEKKVVARQSLQERSQGEGQQKGMGEKGTGGRARHGFAGPLTAGKEAATAMKKGVQKGTGEVASEFSVMMTRKMEEAAATAFPKTISKATVDQIVQYVRLMTRVDGEKEMEIALHEKIFKGLRLKVKTLQGKVEVDFLTSSPEVQSLFLSQKGAIGEALSKKGIDVKEITVRMA